MLKKFYADQEKYSFAFQMMAYISRLKILRDTIAKIHTEKKLLIKKETFDKLPDYILITERSLYTDKYVFAKMLHDQGKIEDVCYQIYLKWFDEFAKDFPIHYSVYVKTYPNNCYTRINKRERDGEDVIPLSYLQDCHNYHELFLENNTEFNSNKIVLDGNIDIYKNQQIIDKWLEEINNFIF